MYAIPFDTGSFLKAIMEETWIALSADPIQGNILGKKARHETFVKWKAPLTNWAALNTDGAAKGAPGQVGRGGILRDATGTFIQGFSAKFGVCNSYRAELLKLEIGLQMVVDQGIERLVIQLDNQACIEALKNAHFQGGESQGGGAAVVVGLDNNEDGGFMVE
uniref:RNase H type-1 domain-containing protein n=1 Tax=Chenopodium quinoa TaxID=63459 RepID=A0A803MBT6_CHEQI